MKKLPKSFESSAFQYRIATRSKKVELFASFVAMLLMAVFWLWLSQHDSFGFGFINHTENTPNNGYLTELRSPFEKDYLWYQGAFAEAYLDGQWLLAYGERLNNTSGSVLMATTENVESLHEYVTLALLPANDYLTLLAQSHYVAILFAGLLLLGASVAFHWLYAILLASVVTLTTWHGLLVARWLDFIQFDTSILLISLVVTAALAIRWAYTHRYFAMTNSLVAMLVWAIFGPAITRSVGLESDFFVLSLFALALFLPWLISAAVAAYLLGQVFNAGPAVTFVIYALCVVGSYLQEDGGYSKQTIEKKIAHVRQLFNKPKRKNQQKGRVTLEELFQQA